MLGCCTGSLLVLAVLGMPSFAHGIRASGGLQKQVSPSPAVTSGLSPVPSPSPATPAPPEPKILVDAIIWATPAQLGVTCITLPQGMLTAVVQFVKPDPEPPVTFAFLGSDPADPAATIRIDVGAEPRRSTVPLSGGHYCYGLNNWGPPADTPEGAPVQQPGRDVTLHLAWSPAPQTP